MLNLLTGNGTNIQFGGRAYTSMFIMERIKYRARLDAYNDLLGGKVTANEIVGMLEGFVKEANAIREGNYDLYVTDAETKVAVEDFKNRYDWVIENSYDIMMEDWFLIVHMFFLKNSDLEEHRIAAVQGCFLQALFGKSCKVFLENVASPNWRKLQSLGWQLSCQPHSHCRPYLVVTV